MRRVRLKNLAQINARQLGEETDPDRSFRYVDIESVGQGKLVATPEQMTFGHAPSRARRLVAIGDTVVSTVRTYLRAVWHIDSNADDLVVSTGFAVISPRDSIEPRFLGWALQSSAFVNDVVARSVGVSYPAINPSALGNITIPIAPTQEQRAIADYLDRETARIDALIEKKQRLVSLLGERMLALIGAQTDTHGAAQLRRSLAEPITDGPHETPNFLQDGIPFISIEAVVDDEIDFQLCRFISQADHAAYSIKCAPRKGDVLLAKTGATIGKTAVVRTAQTFSIWSPLALLRPRSSLLRSEYLWFWLRSMRAQEQIRLAATQSTQPNISMGDIGALRISIPPLSTQDAILGVLRRASAELATLRGNATRVIGLLQEKRQALITAAVTGHIPIPRAT